jgi:hypothetical protein
MASRNAERREPITRGTGNVFADLGFPDAAERQAKLRLAYALNQVLEARKLSQADAAKGAGSDAAEGFCASLLQAGWRWFLCRTPDEPADGARPRMLRS